MDKEPLMKKYNVIFSATMTATFSVVAFANEPDLNSNSFLADQSTQQQGDLVFSFTDMPIVLYEHDNPGILYILKDTSDHVYTRLSWANQKQSYFIGLEKY